MLGWKLSWKVVLLFITLKLKTILSLLRTRRQCRLTCCTFRNKNPFQSTDSIDFSGASNIPTKDDLRNSKYSWDRGIFYTGETNIIKLVWVFYQWHFHDTLSSSSLCRLRVVTNFDWRQRREQNTPGGTTIYGPYRYVPLWRVWFSSSLL